jgi:hypothetical protein
MTSLAVVRACRSVASSRMSRAVGRYQAPFKDVPVVTFPHYIVEILCLAGAQRAFQTLRGPFCLLFRERVAQRRADNPPHERAYAFAGSRDVFKEDPVSRQSEDDVV